VGTFGVAVEMMRLGDCEEELFLYPERRRLTRTPRKARGGENPNPRHPDNREHQENAAPGRQTPSEPRPTVGQKGGGGEKQKDSSKNYSPNAIRHYCVYRGSIKKKFFGNKVWGRVLKRVRGEAQKKKDQRGRRLHIHYCATFGIKKWP